MCTLTVKHAVGYQAAGIVWPIARRCDGFAIAIVNFTPAYVSEQPDYDSRRFCIAFELIGIKALHISTMVLIADSLVGRSRPNILAAELVV
jgi:hypothetical protein